MTNYTKVILTLLKPLLQPLYAWYSSRTRFYSYGEITIKVLPGVFHPGFFFSSKTLLQFFEKQNLKGKHILELGAGTGLISVYCMLRGAQKTCASDISKQAIRNIQENASINDVTIDIIYSDLFENIDPDIFDIIIINPPYYPKKVKSEADHAWFCGEAFDYYVRLFSEIQMKRTAKNNIYMILSQDCDVQTITEIAIKNQLYLEKVYALRKMGEWNYVFLIMNKIGFEN